MQHTTLSCSEQNITGVQRPRFVIVLKNSAAAFPNILFKDFHLHPYKDHFFNNFVQQTMHTEESSSGRSLNKNK